MENGWDLRTPWFWLAFGLLLLMSAFCKNWEFASERGHYWCVRAHQEMHHPDPEGECHGWSAFGD